MRKEHDYLLDMYRILAILMVLSVHINGYLCGKPEMVSKLFSYGAYGVALYFILSGYFSYSSVTKSRSGRQYVWKKAVRILPMYYISLLFTFIVGVFITGAYPLSWEWVWHVFFLNMFIPNREWMWWNSTNFFWTMPAFIAWYILSYFVVKRINRSWQAAVCTLIASIAAPFLKRWMYGFASEQFANWNFFSLLYVFMFGLFSYLVVMEKKIFSGIIYGVGIGGAGWMLGNHSGFFLFSILFYEMIVVTGTKRILSPWLEREKCKKIVFTLSESSYSVYLTHWFILALGGKMFKHASWYLAYTVFIVQCH